MPKNKEFGFVRQERDFEWIRDEQGIAHAIRQSEGVHHSAFCCKYLKGDPAYVGATVFQKCRECWARISGIGLAEALDRPAQCVLRGHGIQTRRRNGVPY